MKRFLIRLILFVTVFPALLVLVFWDVYFHLPAALLVILVSSIGASEISWILNVRGFPSNRYLVPVLGAMFPILAYLELWKLLSTSQVLMIVALVTILISSRFIFAQRDQFVHDILLRVVANFSILIYPSFFSYFMIHLMKFENSSFYLMVFLLATFGNDAMAYVFGNLFGKRGALKISPNKSIAGFMGGFLVSPIVLLVCAHLWPHLFGTWVNALSFGSLAGLATILGDLFESALKRSASVKDSGNVIPGRGGMMDSIDSLLFAAPVFYYYLEFIGAK